MGGVGPGILMGVLPGPGARLMSGVGPAHVEQCETRSFTLAVKIDTELIGSGLPSCILYLNLFQPRPTLYPVVITNSSDGRACILNPET